MRHPISTVYAHAFHQRYAACPIRGPFRAAILTGKFPSTSGYVDNFVSETQGEFETDEDRSILNRRR